MPLLSRLYPIIDFNLVPFIEYYFSIALFNNFQLWSTWITLTINQRSSSTLIAQLQISIKIFFLFDLYLVYTYLVFWFIIVNIYLLLWREISSTGLHKSIYIYPSFCLASLIGLQLIFLGCLV